MKILTRKKQDEILKRIVANEIIARDFISKLPSCEENEEAWEKLMENDADIVYTVDGIKGCMKVVKTLDKKFKEQKK